MLYLNYFIYLCFIFNLISAKYYREFSNQIAKAQILYLNSTPSEQTKETLISDLESPFTWKDQDIKIIIHGWNANRNHVGVEPVKFGYLANGHGAIFLADWEEASRPIYLDARYLVRPVGLRFAKIIEDFISKNSINPEKLHLIGLSLGAHIAGNIGDYFNGTIGRITGLDPAGPLFENFVKDGLLPRHAKFVDCIHTDAPILGQYVRRGHIDFYPNYGKVSQPGCELLDIITGSSCSHFRSSLLYAETIQLPESFPAFSCSLKNIYKKQCNTSKAKNIVLMGQEVSRSAKGTYFVQTNNVSPYGKGKYSVLYAKFKSENNSQSKRSEM